MFLLLDIDIISVLSCNIFQLSQFSSIEFAPSFLYCSELNKLLRNAAVREVCFHSRFGGLTWIWLVTTVQGGTVGSSEARRL